MILSQMFFIFCVFHLHTEIQTLSALQNENLSFLKIFMQIMMQYDYTTTEKICQASSLFPRSSRLNKKRGKKAGMMHKKMIQKAVSRSKK